MGVAGAAMNGATTLQREVSKWRERVPPLLAALRERTEQVERLQAEVAELQDGRYVRADDRDNPGVLARDAIIQELETELGALRDAHARAQGDVHARGVAIDALKRDLHGWKTKWQTLAERLDAAPPVDPGAQRRLDELQQVNAERERQLATLRQRLAEVELERDELKTRNANLFETTGLANRQLESLADDLSALRGELKRLRADYASVAAARDTLEAARTAAVADAAQLEETCAVLCAAAREVSGEAAELQASLAAERQRALRLEGQLQERSALVLSLEAEHEQQRAMLTAATTEAATVRAALDKAEGHARTHADYITQLDDRLDRQKDLLLGLEEELARAQADHAAVVRAHESALAQREAELRALRLQLTGLEALLQAQSAAEVDPVGVAGLNETSARADRDNQSLRILNQQLRDARARNEALLVRVRELETTAAGVGPAADVDELTRIRGVGPRLAEHLRSLGVNTLAEVAALDTRVLDDPAHALASLKARILRDRWIEQAAALRQP